MRHVIPRHAALAALTALTALAAASPAQAAELEFSMERGLRLSPQDSSDTLRVGFLGQMRFEALSQNQGEPTAVFALPIVRPYMSASLLDERLTVFLQPEMGGANRLVTLLDAEAVVALGDCACSPRLSFGYYRPWYTRSFRTNLPLLAFPTRGAVAQAFHGPRSLGVSVGGSPGIFEYHVGAFNGEVPAQISNGVFPRLFTARVALNPLGPTPYTQTPWFAGLPGPRFSVGLNGAFAMPVRASADGGFVERVEAKGAVDVALLTPNLSLLAEGFVTQELELDELSWGAYAQANALLVEGAWDIGVRAGADQRPVPFGDPETTAHVELSTTLYLYGPHARVMIYGRGNQVLDDPRGAVALGSHAQLWF
jgi:hypothetical protein